MASNDLMRLSGINSGYDTEAMIESMMASYQTKIDTQQKKLTKLSWQQAAYRDITTKLTDFKNKYFDVLKRDTYLMSPTTFSKFSSTINSKADGDKASGLKVTTTSNSLEGSYKIKMNQLATASSLKGSTMKPESFALDLDKAAAGSSYTTETDADGNVTRNYSFELDIQVGGVSKTISFSAAAAETDGAIDTDAFRQAAIDSLNTALQTGFGHSGRTGSSATGTIDAEGNEWFLQAQLNADGKMEFSVGGNAAVSVSERMGSFGLAQSQTKHSISTGSCITGKNSVAVEVNGVLKNVEFEGVSSTYYDSKSSTGNEKILAEYNQLKLEAYRRDNGLGAGAVVSQDKLDSFTYSNEQAAKDKNAAAITKALNSAFSDENVTFTISGSSITAKDSNGTAEFSMTATSGGTLGLEKGNASNKYSTKTTLADMGIESNTANGGYSFKINGKEIKLDKGATVNNLIATVNKSGAGVTIEYSTLTNSFNITANEMGGGGAIEIEGNDITKALGLTDADGNEVNFTRGTNAIFELNGQEIYHNANTYTVDGTTFTFDDQMEIGETYSVDIKKSYDDVKQLVKDFVADYNKLIEDVYEHIGTAPKRDDKNNTYEPLTDKQKEEMSEEEIEKWEKAAKTGVIYNDSTVTTIMSQMRSVLYKSVTTDDGSSFGLYAMGIKTSREYNEHGKLEIDEEAFEKAFNQCPEAVTKLFTDSENGIMKQMNTVLDNAVRTTTKVKGTLISKAGLETGSTATDNYIYKQMKQVTDRIAQLQKRYDAKEEYWWSVFTNMESMMSKLNSQSAYLSSYLVQ